MDQSSTGHVKTYYVGVSMYIGDLPLTVKYLSSENLIRDTDVMMMTSDAINLYFGNQFLKKIVICVCKNGQFGMQISKTMSPYSSGPGRKHLSCQD